MMVTEPNSEFFYIVNLMGGPCFASPLFVRLHHKSESSVNSISSFFRPSIPKIIKSVRPILNPRIHHKDRARHFIRFINPNVL